MVAVSWLLAVVIFRFRLFSGFLSFLLLIFLKYPSFINSFEEIINKNSNLAEVEQFYYLRGLLKGKAKTTIEGFILTDENYKEALDLLKKQILLVRC